MNQREAQTSSKTSWKTTLATAKDWEQSSQGQNCQNGNQSHRIGFPLEHSFFHLSILPPTTGNELEKKCPHLVYDALLLCLPISSLGNWGQCQGQCQCQGQGQGPSVQMLVQLDLQECWTFERMYKFGCFLSSMKGFIEQSIWRENKRLGCKHSNKRLKTPRYGRAISKVIINIEFDGNILINVNIKTLLIHFSFDWYKMFSELICSSYY